MNEEEQLRAQIEDLEKQLKPKKERLQQISAQRGKAVQQRIEAALKGRGDFKLDELRFAAYERCSCGAGFAYPVDIDIRLPNRACWDCSAILRGLAEHGSSHSNSMPFAFYEVKSENQPSANGATTRPS